MLTKQNREVVLIVDDNSENHEIIETFLKDLNVQCDHAFDCIEAVTLCTANGPGYYSLILMDINLPHIDGIETTKRLRAGGIISPVVAITALSKSDPRAEQVEDIFEYTIHKPFSFQDLCTAVSPYVKGTLPSSSNNNSFHENVRKNSVCDFSQGISNLGGSRRLFLKHANNFKISNVDLCPRLSVFIDKEEYSQAAILCHSVKGLSGMLGFMDLYDNIIDMEELMHAAEKGSVKSAEISAVLALIDTDIRNICQIQF